MITIYTLTDPQTQQLRYVGKTKHSIQHRLSIHLSEKENKAKVEWIKELTKNGFIPIIEEIEKVSEREAKLFEKYWIQQMISWGFDLLNCHYRK